MIIIQLFAHRVHLITACAAAAGLALSTGCVVGDGAGADHDLDSKATAACPDTVEAWSPDATYKVGDLRAFNGSVFKCLVAHKPAPDWNPIAAASLWSPVDCVGAPVPPPPTGGGGTIGAGGVFDADMKALIEERFFILNLSAKADPARNFTQVTNVGRAGMADIKSLIASGAANVALTASGGTEDVTVTVGAERRLQIRRIKSQGLIEGVMVGAATDAKAPFAMTVGNLDGVLTHTLVVDVGNNLKNDLRGTAPVDNQVVETGGADSVLQQNGGVHAFAEGAAVVNALQFPGIKGF